MNVYSVILDEPNEDVWAALTKTWPGDQHYILNDRTAFIAPEPRDKIILIEKICTTLGINSDQDVRGLVSEVTAAIDGWHSPSFWNWLEEISDG